MPGGTIISAKKPYDPLHPQAAGQTLHGDHAHVFYQKPVNARKYPLVFLHGAGQSARTWESTPDGREGFQNLFLRRGYSVYLVDQPRRGDAIIKGIPQGRMGRAEEITATVLWLCNGAAGKQSQRRPDRQLGLCRPGRFGSGHGRHLPLGRPPLSAVGGAGRVAGQTTGTTGRGVALALFYARTPRAVPRPDNAPITARRCGTIPVFSLNRKMYHVARSPCAKQ